MWSNLLSNVVDWFKSLRCKHRCLYARIMLRGKDAVARVHCWHCNKYMNIESIYEVQHGDTVPDMHFKILSTNSVRYCDEIKETHIIRGYKGGSNADSNLRKYE